MNVTQLYQQIYDQIHRPEISMPELEACELTACACGINRNHLLTQGTMLVTSQMQARAEQLVQQRIAGQPLAYLLGEWDFYGITLHITPDVLIPRSDTERLCELAIQAAEQLDMPDILDLCSGSGCIGLALLHQIPTAHAVGIDLSDAAVAVAQQNAKQLGLMERYTCMVGDAMQSPPDNLHTAFDVMVCNPPYITQDEMVQLDVSVREYEPHLALYGGLDGLDFYRVIVDKWAVCLRPGGILLFECGFAQGQAVAALCRQAGWQQVQVLTDYAGVERIIRCVRAK